MSKHVGEHLRSNVVGYVAIFLFAVGGTAYATHPGGVNTISSEDIINGEVKSVDVGNGEVQSVDIAPFTINSSDIADDAVNQAKILSGAVRSDEIATSAVGSDEVIDESLGLADLGPGSVASDEIVNETITTNDLQSNSVQFDEIEDATVGKADIGPAAVGASELSDGVVTRVGALVNVPGGAGENGSYTVNTATAACNAGEELIGGSGQWSPDDNASSDHELWIAEVRLNTGGESVIVDGGNDSGVDHSIQAVAVCLAV
jgi:hypothetical protein